MNSLKKIYHWIYTYKDVIKIWSNNIHSMYIKIYIHGFSVINNTKKFGIGRKKTGNILLCPHAILAV